MKLLVDAGASTAAATVAVAKSATAAAVAATATATTAVISQGECVTSQSGLATTKQSHVPRSTRHHLYRHHHQKYN